MARTLITHHLILELLKKYRPIWSLNHLTALAHWDMQTYMPKDGIEARGEALSDAATLSQTLMCEPAFAALIEKASRENNLNEYEQGIVRMLLRSLRYYRALPPEFIAEFVKTTNDANPVWEKAKKTNNFALFEPSLEKIVALARKKAEYLGYGNSPYDALLDEFEEGLTSREVETYFAAIRRPLQELLKKIQCSSKYRHEHALEKETYSKEKMHEFTQKVLALIHYNADHLRVDLSAHPFSTCIGKGDVRITTRYEGKDFARSYSATVHEYGHALYDLQSHEDLHYTPIAGGTSLVIHESQSRFWENCIGRSREFLEQIREEVIKVDSKFAAYSLDQMFEYLNLVRPSLIRMEADEITYHFHVMIRYELEKALIEGTLAVKDLPRVWKEKYHEYLGVSSTTDTEGVLQDIHWTHGAIGYFPTYSLGTALSAHWKHAIEKEFGGKLILDYEMVEKPSEWFERARKRKELINQYL